MKVYCAFREWYWYAQGSDGQAVYESRHRTHGSARQAADEVLAQFRAAYPAATMRRLAAKVYEISFPAHQARGGETTGDAHA